MIQRTITLFNRLLADNLIRSRDELQLLGLYLYKVLFSGEIEQFFIQVVDGVRKDNDTILRLTLEFEEDAGDLAEMPWEFIFSPRSKDFIATRDGLILTRHVKVLSMPLEMRPSRKPLKILIAVANVPDTAIVQAKSVIDAIENLKTKKLVETYVINDPTKRILKEELRLKEPHILHFLGHGKWKDEREYKYGTIGLLSDDKSQAEWLDSEDFAGIFNNFQPRLVFLHACEGARVSSADILSGIAYKLAWNKIPAVVAMQYKIENEVANKFAIKFYESLGNGKTVDVAVQEGRNELGLYLKDSKSFSGRYFGSPVIYLQRTDSIIQFEEESENGDSSKFPVTTSQLTTVMPGRVPFQSTESTTKIVNCPRCLERILSDRVKCRYCKALLETCPMCGKLFDLRDVECDGCGKYRAPGGQKRTFGESEF
jgi:CHAT domain